MANNNTLKAQFALMAALQPEQFIELAMREGLTPERFAKSTGIEDFKKQSGAFKNRADTENTKMGAPPPSGTMQAPPAPAGPTPVPPTGPSPALMEMMGLNPQMGAPPIAGPVQAGPNPQPGNLNSLVAPNAATAMPGPAGPLVQLPTAKSAMAPLNAMAGGLAGLWETVSPSIPPQADIFGTGPAPAVMPTQPTPFMGAPPTGQLPPQVPAMGNPGEVSPEAMAAISGMMPAPQQGIVHDPNEAITGNALSHILSPNSELGKLNAQMPPYMGISPESAIGQILGIGQTPPVVPGAGLSSPAMPAPPPAGPNVSQFDLMMGGPAPTPMVPTPPPNIAEEVPPQGVTLKPVSSAQADVVTDTTKKGPGSGSPKDKKDTFDALAAVGKAMGGGGGSGRGRGAPGGAGVRQSAIQQGELLDLIMKSFMKPATYSPGFIPFGKF